MTATIPPIQTDCPPPPPRSVNDGVVIFVCEHEGTTFYRTHATFMDIVRDPPKARPTCTTCGKPAKHVGPDAARRLLDGEGR